MNLRRILLASAALLCGSVQAATLPTPDVGTPTTATQTTPKGYVDALIATAMQAIATAKATACTAAGSLASSITACSGTTVVTTPTPPPIPTPTPTPTGPTYAGQPSTLPNVVISIDPALPAGTGALTAGTPGIQVDGSGNVLAVTLPSGEIVSHGYGEATLVTTGGAGNKPYFHDIAASFKGGYEGLNLPATTATLLQTAGQSVDVMIVGRKLTTAGGDILRFKAGNTGFATYGVQSASDCALHIEDNRGSSYGDEPTSALTACGQNQVWEFLADAGAKTFTLLHNGTATFTTPAGTVAGFTPTVSQMMNQCGCDISFAEITKGVGTLAQRNSELTRLASLYAITGTSTITSGPSGGIAPAVALGPDPAATFLTTVNRPTTPLPSVPGSAPGNGITFAGLTNVFDATFGTGGNVTTDQQRDSMFWNNYLSGDMNNPIGAPGDTGQQNPIFHAVARHFAPGDPNDINHVAADGLKLKAICSRHTDCSVGNVWAALDRLPNVFKPGMYIQVDYRSAPGNHEWNPIWLFTGEQPIPAPGADIRSTIRQGTQQHLLEIDTNDNFSRFGDGTATGHQINFGLPNIYGDSFHVAPRLTYAANDGGGTGFIYHPAGPPYLETPFDWSAGRHSLGLNWRPSGIMDVLVDGKVIATEYLEWNSVCAQYTAADGSTQCVGLNLMLGNQAIPNFSPGANSATENDGITTPDQEGWTQTIYRIAGWNGNIANPDGLRAGTANGTPVANINGPPPPAGLHGLTLNDAGSAYVERRAAMTVGTQKIVVKGLWALTQSDIGSGAKLWGPWGNYNDEWRFRLAPGGKLEFGWQGNDSSGTGHNNYVLSKAAFSPTVGNIYQLEGDLDPVAGTVSFYADLASAGTRTLLGVANDNQGQNYYANPSTVAITLAPLSIVPVAVSNIQIGESNNDLREGTPPDGNNDFRGTFFGGTVTIGGTQVLAPVITANSITDASAGNPVWGVVTVAAGGSAVFDSHLQAGGPAAPPTAAPPPVGTQLISFTGSSGAPTGNKVVTQLNTTDPATAVLNGSGSLVFDSSDAIGTLFGLGVQTDGTYTFAVSSGGASAPDIRIPFRVSGTGATASEYVAYFNFGGNNIGLLKFVNGSFVNTVYNQGPCPQPTSSVALKIAGSTFTLLVDGNPVGSFTDNTISANGYLGIGGNGVGFSGISATFP